MILRRAWTCVLLLFSLFAPNHSVAAPIFLDQDWAISASISVPREDGFFINDGEFLFGNTAEPLSELAVADVTYGTLTGRATVWLQSTLTDDVISAAGTVQTRSSAERQAGGVALFEYLLVFTVTDPQDWVVTAIGRGNFAFASLSGDDGFWLNGFPEPAPTRVTLNPGVIYTIGLFGNTDTRPILPDFDFTGSVTLVAVPEPGTFTAIALGLFCLVVRACHRSTTGGRRCKEIGEVRWGL